MGSLPQFACWDSRIPFVDYSECPVPAQLESTVVHRAGEDAFVFLHDTAVTVYKGRLLVAWYNCTAGEIVGRTVIRGRWSEDGGRTWSEPEWIAGEREASEFHYVPVSLLPLDNRLLAFVTKMTGHDRPVSCGAYAYTADGWQYINEVAGAFLPNTAPVKLSGGRYMMGGRCSAEPGQLPLIPAVAVASAHAVDRQWTVSPLPVLADWAHVDPFYPETAIVADGSHIAAFVRNDHGADFVYESNDEGAHWEGPYSSSLPTIGSKLYAGMLASGQRYLIYNAPDHAHTRGRLVIAVSRPGEQQLVNVYTLLEGAHAELECGPEWSYPCAIEDDGILYISCTSEKKHAILMKLPVDSLAAD